jgi:ADP-ribose pyrophosphatase YjhB (NUDIX family)
VDDLGRILLVRPTYKSYWDIPGGYVEPGETPRTACIREVHEELGIRPTIGELLTVDWAPHPNEGDKVLFIFDGGTLSDEMLAQVQFQDGEIDQYDFVTIDRLPELTIDRLTHRLRESLAARRGGTPMYLEHGQIPNGAHPGR